MNETSRSASWTERVLDTQQSRWAIVLIGMLSIGLIAIGDLKLTAAIPLSPLYALPMILLSSVLQRWQIVLVGMLCTIASEYADAFDWNVREGVPRDAFYLFAYIAVGLYVYETVRRRRAERVHSVMLTEEMETRRGIEEQLQLVVANSSIAIVTADSSGTILDANDAARQMWAAEGAAPETPLEGMRLERFIPPLARVNAGVEGFQRLRTMMQCQGFRANHDPFLADVWFSTYTSSKGGRLTAMIIDCSNETRDREQANLEHVLVSSRIALGALSHEIRNICAAISNVQRNLLATKPDGRQGQEFDALQQLVAALERMASTELSLVKRQAARVKLDTFLGDLYVVVQASLRESEIELEWNITSDLPAVWADPSSLMQVFLNLVRNAIAAFEETPRPTVRISASRDEETVSIRVSDNGPGITHPETLFRPFGEPGGGTGLGLYLSRAMMRSFRGELRYEPAAAGATFVVDLNIAEVEP